jgi:hypothetical protein
MKKLISLFMSLALVSLLGLPSANAADNATAVVSASVVATMNLTAVAPSALHLSQGGSPVAVTDGTVTVTAPNSVAYTVKIHSANASGAASLASIITPADQIPAATWGSILSAGASAWGVKVTGGGTTIAGQVGYGDTAINNTDLTFYTNTGNNAAQTANLSFKAVASSSQAVHADYQTTVYYTAFPS